ncbi:alkaline phosphatase [Cohnella endophytica]|uniref:Alkaline phosphatase n=1 Tax=Cohnella endophytica TaxID=2419778 RepID=A0A494Y621_9BACL|nr:VTT domain-containing protein [Cohnella endophytica]RKP58072.1 alkaline phosphatase [Cohnella endophytica]
MSHLTDLLEQYGYGVLFLALFLEMLALPLPGELLMTYAGLIVYQGKLNWVMCIVAGGTGTSLGMTVSYYIGYRLGYPFFEKYGSRVHFGPDRLNSVSVWFGRYGSKMLLISYYIPGVRHLTGYFSGISRMPFRQYAVHAYTGAFLWVAVFVTIGKLFGKKWEQYHHLLSRYFIIAGIMVAVVYLLVLFYRKNKQRMKLGLNLLLHRGLLRYHAVGQVKLIVIGAGITLFVLFTVIIGLITFALQSDLAQLDEMGTFLVRQFFGADWTKAMGGLTLVASPWVLFPAVLLACAWIWYNGKDAPLELAFYAIVFVGGEEVAEAWEYVFRMLGMTPNLTLFPSSQSWLTIVGYGFAAYLLVRHHARWLNQIAAVFSVTACCLVFGISFIFLERLQPSEVVTGFLFGGGWLALNIVWLEIYRSLQRGQVPVVE